MIEKKDRDLCYICGSKPATTRDHIFPLCLFNSPAPSNLPKRLPACFECNTQLSKDEEIFRFFMASGKAYESQAGNCIWKHRIRPDLHGKREGLKPLIRSMIRKARITDKSGGTITYSAILEVNRNSINNVFYKMAKGLYYLDTNQVLSEKVNILIGYYAEIPEILSPPLDNALEKSRKVELGNGAVTYWRNFIKGYPEESLTWIQFYEDKMFLICTTRNEIPDET